MAAMPPIPPEIPQRSGASRNKSKKPKLVVGVNPKPRDYAPNSGPGEPRVTLLPPEDSTAYIVSRLFLPPKGLSARDGKPLPKRMIYIVGWRDLPAAKIMVPVMRVLDYVSPAELEAWESANEEELDVEREEAERARELEAGVDGGEVGATMTSTDPSGELRGPDHERRKPGRKRKRGRPPTKMRLEPASAADMEEAGHDDAQMPLKGGALALSITPKKGLALELDDMGDDEDASPSRLAGSFVMGMGDPSESRSPSGVTDAGGGEEEFYDAEEIMDVDVPMGRAQSPEVEEDQEEEEEDSQSSPVSRDVAPWQEAAMQTAQIVAADAEIPDSASSQDELAAGGHVATWASFGASNQRAAPKQKPAFPHLPSSNESSSRSSPMPRLKAEGTDTLTTTPNHTTSKKTKTTPKKREKKKKTPVPDEEAPAEPENGREWVVERLEDHKVYEVEGEGIVRYFKVRWEGDWPPDQNPTWEPEHNLPEKLVRNYFKRGKRPLKPLPPPSSKAQGKDPAARTRTPKQGAARRNQAALKQSTLSWAKAKRYSNVSEAFADEDDSVPEEEGMFGQLMGPHHDNGSAPPMDGAGHEEEELFVVDERPSLARQTSIDWGGLDRFGFLGAPASF